MKKYGRFLKFHLLWPGPCQPVSGWWVYSKIWAPIPFQAPPKKIFRKAKTKTSYEIGQRDRAQERALPLEVVLNNGIACAQHVL
jgi:hypothetical protein